MVVSDLCTVNGIAGAGFHSITSRSSSDSTLNWGHNVSTWAKSRCTVASQ